MLPTPYHGVNMMSPWVDRDALEKLLLAHDEAGSESDVSSQASSQACLSYASSYDDETTLQGYESASVTDSELDDDDDDYSERYQDDPSCSELDDPHVHFVLSRNEICYYDKVETGEKIAVWYTDDEYLSFSNEILALSIKMSTSHNAVLHETEYQTARGLEHKTREISQQRRRRYADLLQAVFAECERQCWNRQNNQNSTTTKYTDEYEEDECIAIQAYRVTAISSKEARQRGRADQDFVQQMYIQEQDAASHSYLPEHVDLPPRSQCRKGSLDCLGSTTTTTTCDDVTVATTADVSSSSLAAWSSSSLDDNQCNITHTQEEYKYQPMSRTSSPNHVVLTKADMMQQAAACSYVDDE